MKFFIGPMSKNTVDAIIEYSEEYKADFTFIPSRRQVDVNGGYVNQWTTKEFVEYVKGKSSILVERDHGGPGQGYLDDDGYTSLKCDAENLDIIHIDPWKKYPVYEEGLKWTIDMILYCYNINKKVYYEIGTEEAIRPFSLDEMERFLKDISMALDKSILNQIKYVVVQCGTKLVEKENTGEFSSEKLTSMLNIVNNYRFEAKEHNGDWVSLDVIKKKNLLGLNNINIAPEFGEIETNVILNSITKDSEEFEELFTVCYKSNRWVKWVNSSFDPFNQKELLIHICGHYIFTDPFITKLKEKYTHLDTEIKAAIKNKLTVLHSVRSREIYYYSQSKEDIYLNTHYFKGKKNGTYVELGAVDGVLYSNTKFFQDTLNWKGILIEPLPSMFSLLKKNRPNDLVFNEIVSSYTSELEFKVSDEHPAVSTLAISQLKNWGFGSTKSIYIKPKTLTSIIKSTDISYIDLLSLDVEGHEYEVLQSWDFSVPIYIILIEQLEENKDKNKLCREILEKNCYTYSESISGNNDIYINNSLVTTNNY